MIRGCTSSECFSFIMTRSTLMNFLSFRASSLPEAASSPKEDESEGVPGSRSARRDLNLSHSLSDSLAPSLTAAEQPHTYSLRSNSGSIVCSYGEGVESSSWKADFSQSPELKELTQGREQPIIAPYNFMFEKLRDCVQILDDAIYMLGKEIMDSLHIEEVASLGSLSNEHNWYLGRIACDSVGRLNPASVLLEGDQEHSRGVAIRLDLSQLKSFSLFPGQVVLIKGCCTSGKGLVAQEIIPGRILPGPQFPLSLPREGIQMRVACGPFTTTEDLFYEPLNDLLRDVASNPPHFLFLVGPLLDASHPALNDAALADTYDSILTKCLNRIDAALKSLRTQVYVVASQYDIACTPIYPTPPVFTSCSVNAGTDVKLLPDPSLVVIDGFSLAFTTIDYPMHIGREEISFSPQTTDRLSRFSQHILLQQSLYPIYPPPEGTNFNLERTDQCARLPFTPHLIVTPSDLKGYIRKVDGCVFVNPGRLAKGRTGGCHCKVEVKTGTDPKTPQINIQILKI